MYKQLQKYYFLLLKLFFIVSGLIYISIIRMEKGADISVSMLLSIAVFLSGTVMFELYKTEYSKKQHVAVAALAAVAIAVFLLIWYYSGWFVIMLPLILLDAIAFFIKKKGAFLLVYIGIFIAEKEIRFDYFVVASFLMVLYFQHYGIVLSISKHIEEDEIHEQILKKNISQREIHYHNEMNRNRLLFDNKILDEKSRLSQELHDKLGHSINGSLYQLEAGKALIPINPEKSKAIIQSVIDNLRGSMDQIRAILRKERPDKKQLAMIQLNSLCEECREKYGIEMIIRSEGDIYVISEKCWDIILDNCFEAVSNALKYAKCSRIDITIIVMNKFVRCTVSDNGKGCNDMKEGMGLSGMRDRVRGVNGFLNFDLEHGFTINMLLPNDKKAEVSDNGEN